jgi:adenylosuccinate lyase
MAVIHSLARTHQNTPMIGRTHGVHAEPITFGVKLANWHAELARHVDRLLALNERAASGKLSGAVGIYTLPPSVEQQVCARLNLKPIVATQIISRDIHAEYLCVLALIGGTIAKIAIAGRMLQQTEVGEVQEEFSKNQTGSSAMPHKRNPIGLENMTGMARALRGYAVTGLENQETWHERDLANSGPERIVLADASILLDYMVHRMRSIVQGWVVNPERMLANINMTGGLVFSQNVQSALANKSGMARKDAYGIVRDIAQACFDSRQDFRGALLDDPRVTSHLSPEELDECFSLPHNLRHVDHIFHIVFSR